MSANDFDELVQKVLGVHCCCGAVKRQTPSSNMETKRLQAKPRESGQTDFAREQPLEYRRATHSPQFSGHIGHGERGETDFAWEQSHECRRATHSPQFSGQIGHGLDVQPRKTLHVRSQQKLRCIQIQL
jgi:hypothetical protein